MARMFCGERWISKIINVVSLLFFETIRCSSLILNATLNTNRIFDAKLSVTLWVPKDSLDSDYLTLWVLRIYCTLGVLQYLLEDESRMTKKFLS